MTEPLDPLGLPLHGSRLIEASAGTGKTWTIAALYLRLVLGHGDAGSAFARPLAPAEILVMTYTRAATRELSDRIRGRLIEAAACFRGEATPAEGDGLLPSLLAAYPAGDSRNRAAWRLANAAQAMDEAAVQTIDAWCQRMLREHAFDSGSLFDEELVADDLPIVDAASRDYWRQQIYPLAGAALDTALTVWPSAAALVEDVRELLGRSQPEDEPPSLAELVERLTAQRHELLGPLKANWRVRTGLVGQWLDAQLADKTCPFNRQKLQSRHYTRWLDALGAWAEGPSLDGPALTETAQARLRTDGMLAAVKDGRRVDLPDHFQHFDDLIATLDALPDFKRVLRLHAATCVATRVVELKRRAGTFGFPDLQERLGRALEGPNAERLRARIVEQYPVALVDEFQDTSPRQYGIFERLYRPAASEPTTALFLIGDPKQSIYGFRGADIYSYLRARRATAGRHYALATNHRSTAALVGAVNRLFGQAEARDGTGAFLFRTSADDPLPFQAVTARGRGERLVTGAGPVPAFTVCHDTEPRDSGTHRDRYAALCAERIVALLGDPAAGFAGPDGFARLRPADLAVIVRTGKEAGAVRRQLQRRGVASVYLSDSETVFRSPEARDLIVWLRAVADPADTRLARAAFASSLVGFSLDELLRLASDEAAWDERLDDLRTLHGVWQRQGVLTMLRQTLHRLDLPARWLAAPDGERRLTNVLHLAELLQAATAKHEGEQALVRWLIEQVQEKFTTADERIVRLESDDDLVKVITIHKSKGLEFPVVFLPFATGSRTIDRKKGFLEVVDDDGTRSLDFAMSDDALARVDRERLREDVRLLYVALTRARHAIWVGAATPAGRAGLHRSAFGHLLSGGTPVAPEQLVPLLRAARGECADIVLEAADEDPGFTRHRAAGPQPVLPPAPVYAGRFERDWSIGSFSTLVRDIGGRVESTPALRHDEPVEAASGPGVGRAAADVPWHRFPRGTLPGNFLHEQLNWMAEEGFGLDALSLQERLRRRCEQRGWGHRQDDAVAWLQAIGSVVLPPLGTSLGSLETLLPEMEFWLPAERLHAREVDAICRRHLLGGRDRPPLPQQQLHGMLMGFADLVFEHAGRYWVLDYKSNALGQGDAAYTTEAFEGAIAGHRYDVQGALYLLALHRLLHARLGAAYRPEHHLGGAIFFFIRGIRAGNAGCHVLPADPAMLDELDALLTASKALA